MNESFLHYVWRHRLFNPSNLQTTDGEKISIIHPGFAHQHAGPDFKQSVVKINDIMWAGDVEIHVKSSDWLKHHHQNDPKYNSVILHVVYEHDVELYKEEKRSFPTFVLGAHIPETLIRRYMELSTSKEELVCRRHIQELNPLTMTSFLSRVAIERLLSRQHHIFEVVSQCEDNWEEAFFRILAISFGFKTNEGAFDLLGRSIPFHYLSKHLTARTQIYALIFGQAGMLEEPCEDDYYLQLSSEYQYLRYKYKLTPIPKSCWNYLRLRPKNFPCIRLAEFSELLFRAPKLFNNLLEGISTQELLKVLSVTPDAYWQTHYHFGKCVKSSNLSVGKAAAFSIIINTLVPILFSYSVFHGDETMQNRAVSVLESVEFEENSITRIYREIGFPTGSALDSQAILQLKREYCSKKQCLKCSIGSFILRR
ncbi:MAG: DUF2851 family protein [Bacteroidales bacterium]|jgi:hypothetical protein|nr:DUF2851 family protein [Bacteroidales bacterium]